MTSLNISLPESMREFVEAQVASGGYGTASEYIRDLIRHEQKRRAEAKLEALLLEGLNGPARELTDEDWEAIREEGMKRLSARKDRPR